MDSVEEGRDSARSLRWVFSMCQSLCDPFWATKQSLECPTTATHRFVAIRAVCMVVAVRIGTCPNLVRSSQLGISKRLKREVKVVAEPAGGLSHQAHLDIVGYAFPWHACTQPCQR